MAARQDLVQEVVDLVLRRAHLNLGVEQSGGADELLHHNTLGLLQLVVGWRGRHVDHLMDHVVKLLEAQWAVVEGRRQAETILHKVLLAGAIATIHGIDLWHADVALVDDQQEILGEEIEQAIGALAGFAPVEIARVVLNARAVAQLLDHLHVILHALLDALGLDAIAQLLEVVDLSHQVVLYPTDGALGLLLARHKEVGRINLVLVETLQRAQGERVALLDGVDLVVPPTNAQHVVAVGHGHQHRIALDGEIASLQVDVVAHIERVDQLAEKLIAVELLAAPDGHHVLLHRHGCAHTIDARHRRHDDDVLSARQQVADGGQTELVDLFVDGEVFLNIGVGGGQISLGLIVVVIRHVIVDGVIGEEAAHLLIELGGERLVMAQYQRGLVDVGNDIGHRERLTRTGHTKQHLGRVALAYAVGELPDGLGLVARGLEL